MTGRVILGLTVLLGALGLATAQRERPRESDWEGDLARSVERFGHRNWIVIADSAYPQQSRAGIATVVTDAEHLEVVQKAMALLSRARHVRPVIYLDAELPHIEERDAPGITRFRARLTKALGRNEARSLAHEKIIDRLDRAGEKFSVLVLKTNLTLPYTSVFIELDCGYWSEAAEKRLRKAMEKGGR